MTVDGISENVPLIASIATVHLWSLWYTGAIQARLLLLLVVLSHLVVRLNGSSHRWRKIAKSDQSIRKFNAGRGHCGQRPVIQRHSQCYILDVFILSFISVSHKTDGNYAHSICGHGCLGTLQITDLSKVICGVLHLVHLTHLPICIRTSPADASELWLVCKAY